YAYLFFCTIARRPVKHFYVDHLFYRPFIIVTAIVHLVIHALLPGSLGKSYSASSGATDAMIPCWYGHRVLDFILPAGLLRIMYYLVRKQPGRPISSYRRSIARFRAIISTSLWTGPHHLPYTALPYWAQPL
ncbi:cbb3-type cytochrome c oxidase subunit I, partial [Pseudomonas aeruginosa]